MNAQLRSVCAVFMLGAMLLAGCAPSPSGGPPISAGRVPVTLLCDVPLTEFEKLVEKSLPDVDLRVELTNSAFLNGDTLRRLRAGEGTDLIYTSLPESDISEFLLDLSPYGLPERFDSSVMESVTQSLPSADHDNPAVRTDSAANSYDDNPADRAAEDHASTAGNAVIRCLPMPGTCYGLIVNQTLTERLGRTLPRTQQEFTDMLRAARSTGEGATDDGIVFAFENSGYVSVGEMILSTLVPDFLSTPEGQSWTRAFRNRSAGMAGTLDLWLDFFLSVAAQEYMDPGVLETSPVTRNASELRVDMAQETYIACYGSTDLLEEVRAENPDDIFVMLPFLSGTGRESWYTSAPCAWMGINAALYPDEYATHVSGTIDDDSLSATIDGTHVSGTMDGNSGIPGTEAHNDGTASGETSETAAETPVLPDRTPQSDISAFDKAARLDAAVRVLDIFSTHDGQSALLLDTGADYSCLAESVPTEWESGNTLYQMTRFQWESGHIYQMNHFQNHILWAFGRALSGVCAGKTELRTALKSVDTLNQNGPSGHAEDHSLIGTAEKDLIYAQYNTRREETEIGNLVADAVAEMTDTDAVFISGGGIRSSIFAGDVFVSDLAAVCPSSNTVVILEVTAEVLAEMLENSIRGIYYNAAPAGRFLQVSHGVSYTISVDRSAELRDETGATPARAHLIRLNLPETSRTETGMYRIAVSSSMCGALGYENGAGDGFTMLNVFSDTVPKWDDVRLILNTGRTYAEILTAYFRAHADEPVTAQLEGRITVQESATS